MSDLDYSDVIKKVVPSNPNVEDLDYSGIINKEESPPVAALKQSMYGASDKDPDQQAKVVTLAKKTGIPTGIVDRNYKEVAKDDERDSMNYEGIVGTAPIAARMATENPDIAPAMKDDFDKLGMLESWARQASLGWQKGNLDAKLAELRTEQLNETRKTGVPSQKFQTDIDDIKKQLEPLQQLDSSVGKNFHPIYQTLAQLPNMTRAFVKTGAKSTGFDAFKAVESNPESIALGGPSAFSPEIASDALGIEAGPGARDVVGGTVAGGAAGAAIGGVGAVPGAARGAQLGMTVGMARYAYDISAGSAYDEYVGLTDKSGKPVDPVKAAETAHMVGLINAGLQTAGELLLARTVGPAFKAVGGSMSGAAMNALSKIKIPGAEGIISTITENPKVFAGMTLSKAVQEAGKHMIEGLGGQMANMYAQNVVTGEGANEVMSATAKARGQAESEFPTKSQAEILGDATNVLYPAFQATLPFGILGGIGHMKNEMVNMHLAEQQKQAYLELGKIAGESKFWARLPEEYKSFVHAATKDGPVEAVYVPAEAFHTYFQGKNITPEQAAHEIGISPKELADTKAAGGYLKVPTSTWAEKVVGTPHFEGLADDVTFNPEIPTSNQVKQTREHFQSAMKEQIDNAGPELKKGQEEQTGVEAVYRTMNDALINARPESIKPRDWSVQADKNARIWAARSKVIAAEQGISVEQAFDQIKPAQIRVGDSVVPISSLTQASEVPSHRPEVLAQIRDEIQRAKETYEPGSLNTNEEGAVTGRNAPTNAAPAYFKGKGYSTTEALKAIDKATSGGELTDTQRKMVDDLYFSSGYDKQHNAAVAKQQWFMQASRTTPTGVTLSSVEDFPGEPSGNKVSTGELPEGYRLRSDPNAKPEHKHQIMDRDNRIAGFGATPKEAFADFERVDQNGGYGFRVTYERDGGRHTVQKTFKTIKDAKDFVAADRRDNVVSGSHEILSVKPYGNTLYQSPNHAPAFYSKLQQTVQQKMGTSATIEQVHGILKDVKEEERKWSGIDEFLKGKSKVSKEDLQNFLRANQLEVKEVTKGAAAAGDAFMKWANETYGDYWLNMSDFEIQQAKSKFIEETGAKDAATKFTQHTLPGGENYREQLFTLPNAILDKRKAVFDEYQPKIDENRLKQNTAKGAELSRLESEELQLMEARDARADSVSTAEAANAFRSSHWDEPNVLAHARLDDRTDADGKKVLFVQEIQSDWHQEGRKKGYRDGEGIKPLSESEEAELTGLDNKRIKAMDKGKALSPANESRYQELSSRWKDSIQEPNKVPNAPFKKTWHEFVLKRLIREAAEKGYDKVAWTTGEQQAERYDLSKKVELQYKKQAGDTYWLHAKEAGTGHDVFERTRISHSELEGIVGKDVARKIISGEGETKKSKSLQSLKDRGDPTGVIEKGGDWYITFSKGEEFGTYGSKESAQGEAERIREMVAEDHPKVLKGDDLKVGGQGMKGFYDKILPDFANKFGKKWGAKVSDTSLNVGATDLGREFYVATNDKGKYWVTEGSPGAIDGEYFKSEADAKAHLKDKFQTDVSTPAAKVHSLEITPALREAALNEGFQLFQADGQDPRGSVHFAPEGAIVSLYAKADKSTFLHESGHIFLNHLFEMSKAGKMNDALMPDWEILSDWLGVEKGQEVLTEEQHETFARGFEAYVMKGEAPSEYLKSTFRSFARWLTKIYRGASALNVEISPEVKGVMDRLMATEDEINAAAAATSFDFEISPENLTPEAIKDIAQLRAGAKDEAWDIMLKNHMAEISLERREFLRAAREKAKEEVTKEVNALPVYENMDLMESYFKDDMRNVAKKYLEGTLPEKQRAEFDAHADLMAYSSGDHMAKEFASATPKMNEIAKRVDANMAQYADLKDQVAVREEAQHALHNEKSLEVLALESEILRSLKDVKDPKKAKYQVNRVKVRLEVATAREQAREILSGKTIREATQFTHFFSAERQAAVKVAKNIAAKDFYWASVYKKEQMVSHAMAMESIKIKRQVEKNVAYLDRARTVGADSFKNEIHYTQVAKLLARFGFERNDFNPNNTYQSLSEWQSQMEKVTNTVDIADWVFNESIKKRYRDLTGEELQDVRNAVENIRTVARMENRAYAIGENLDLNEAAVRLGEAFRQNVPEKHRYNPSIEPGGLEQIQDRVSGYSYRLLNAHDALLKLDGYKDFGPWHELFIKPVYEAANRESAMMREYAEKQTKLWEPYSKAELKTLSNDLVYVPELDESVTKLRLIQMALNLGNAGNRQRLFDTPPIGIRGSVEWNERVAMKILTRELDARDWHMVQGTWDMVNDLWPGIAELHSKLTGFTPEKVQAMPFTVISKDGQAMDLRGGYYPLKQDSRGSVRALVQESAETPLYEEQNMAWKKATKQGHTKERAKEASYAVSLSTTITDRHLRDAIHDIAFRAEVIDLRRLVGKPEVQEAMLSGLGKEGYKAFDNWLGAVASGSAKSEGMTSVFESSLDWLRRRSVPAALMFRLGTLAKHLTNVLKYPGAMEGFGYKESMNAIFVRGLMGMPSFMKNREMVFEKSEFMKNQHANPDASISDARRKAFGKDNLDHVVEMGSSFIAASLEVVNVPMWLEAYDREISRNGNDEKKAIHYADTLVGRVVGSGRRYDIAPIQRGSSLEKALSMFYTPMRAEYGQWQRRVGIARVGDSKDVARTIGFVASRLFVVSLATSLISGHGPDDKEDWSTWALREMLKEPLGMLPVFREIGTVALDYSLGKRTFGYSPTPAVEPIESFLELVKHTNKYARGNGDGQEVLEHGSKMAAYGFGYPQQLNDWFWNAYDYYDKGNRPQYSDLLKRRPKKER